MALTAAVGLWTIDVLLNLALIEQLLAAHSPFSRPFDFVGLFMAGLPISIVLVSGALVATPLLARLLQSAAPHREAVVLLSAALSASAVFARVVWAPSRTAILAALFAAGATGLVICFGARAHLVARDSDGAGSLSRFLVVVPLFAGFIAEIGASLPRGEHQAALLSGLQAIVLVGLFLPGLLRPAQRWSSLPAWLPVLAAVACGVLVCVSSSRYGEPDTAARRSAVDGRPNIVLIVLDTVRADHLQRYGYGRDTMPALERWIDDGAFVFQRAVSTAGWTSPAHASLFSGLTVSRHGIHYASGTAEDAPLSTPAVEGVSWLPAKLAEQGYECLAVTANELAIPDGIQGFDRILAPSRTAWSRLTFGSLADRLFPWSRRLSELLRWRMPYVDAGEIVDIAMRALPDDSRPIFLFFNVLDAHSPYNPHPSALKLLGLDPGHLFSRYERHRQLTRMWASLPTGREQALIDLYDGELRWIDDSMERLLRWVDERMGPNTVVVITSDHGEELGEDGRVGHEFGLSQRLIHVPLFVKGPGLPTGESSALVSLRSIFPFAEHIGAGMAPDLNDLLDSDEHGILSERYPSGHNQRVLGPEYARTWISLIEGELKAIGPSSAGWSFYDVESSGFDQELPLTGDSGGEVLKARVELFWERYQDRRALDEGALSEEELRRLRSLGYVK